MVFRRRAGHPAGTKKRTLAAILWLYAGWYAGAMLAEIIGVSALLGPLIGAAAAGLVAGDPRGLIWSVRDVADGRGFETVAEPA